MVLRGVRGGITVDDNSREAILQGTKELLEAMINENEIEPEDMAAIIFSATPDLNAAFPAAAARELGLSMVPLFCCSEIDVPGAPARCIRILLLFNTEKRLEDIRHVYRGEARSLRPDLA